MKKFRHLVRESRVEDEGLPSEAALSLKDRRNKEAMPKLREQNDTTEKEEMAETQLHFIKYAAEEILEFIDMDGEIEEWYQNKLSKVHSDMEGLHSYIEGEKRRTGMVKEASAEELLAVGKKVSPNAKISTPETRKKDKEDYEKRTAKYAGKPNTPSAYLNRPQSYPLGGYDPKSNRSYSEEYESVPASKALQKAHEDERKRRGLPDPDYYLKLRDQKKKEIEDMKKEEVKQPTGGLKDACWKGYTAVGMKMKNGRKVPNCVPKEEVEIEEGYYKNQEIERQETERLAKQPPFTPDKPKKQVVAGKKPEGYSTARHLARQAMQKYKKPVKESLEESRRAEIVKEIIKKKKNEDKFNAEPIISDTVTRNT